MFFTCVIGLLLTKLGLLSFTGRISALAVFSVRTSRVLSLETTGGTCTQGNIAGSYSTNLCFIFQTITFLYLLKTRWRHVADLAELTREHLFRKIMSWRWSKMPLKEIKHFLCLGQICARNKCCTRGQTGKYLCPQQCPRLSPPDNVYIHLTSLRKVLTELKKTIFFARTVKKIHI